MTACCTNRRHHRKLVFNKRSNPLRRDPTRTLTIRLAFIADLKRRFRKLRAAVIDFIYVKDALALKPKKLGIAFNVNEREFEFRTDAAKLAAFQEWFKQQVEANIFSVPEGTPIDRPWVAKYVESSYKKGMINAYIASRQAQVLLDLGMGATSSAAFLQQAFNQPEALGKVALLAQRTFEDLRGVTSTMASQLNNILATGMINGSGAAEIAREMVARIDSLSAGRALTIARTEMIHAHSEGQLDAYKELGVQELGINVEWSTAGDDRVCPICAARQGEVLTVDEARGIIPIHPNCRCTWLPAVGQILAGL